MKSKQLLKALKKNIEEGFGRKCDDFTVGCFTCIAWRLYEDLEDLLSEAYEK